MQVTPKSKKGFTLVELLVAIAIIATLASLAVVGTRIALKKASAAKTANNMKSIGAFVEAFAQEGLDTGNNPPGTFPPYEGSFDDELNTSFVWWDLIGEELGAADRKSGDFDWQIHPSTTELQNPLSTKKLGGSGDFYSFSNSTNTRGSYAYNASLGGDFEGEEGAYTNTVAIANIADGPNTIVFGESDDTLSTAGHHFSSVGDAPQGNYNDGVHCYFYGGAVKVIKNIVLKKPHHFEFYTNPTEKNYDNQP